MLIIGIAGGTGSGKTTVVNNILNNLNSQNVLVISQDNYYKAHNDLSFAEREKINFDHPRSIDFDLLTENIQDLKNGKTDRKSTRLNSSHVAISYAVFCLK